MPFSARAGFMSTDPVLLWTPADITSKMWLDALSDGFITYGIGITVASWAQKNTNTSFTSSGSARPIYDSTNNAVQFDGATTFMGASDIFGLGGNPALTTVALITPATVPSGQSRFYQIGEGGTGSKPVAHSFGRNSTDGLASFQFNDGYETYNHIAADNTQIMTTYTRTSGGDYTAGTYYLNGTEKTAIDNDNPTFTPNIAGTVTEIGRGELTSGYNYASVKIHELVTVEASDDATRQKIEGYMAWRWGVEGDLPVGHPYKTAAPLAI